MQQQAVHNQPEYTVSEISGAIKRTVENAFGYVRVRGEISQPKLYSSGHLYLTLKDEGAALSAVCWKGNVGKLKVKAEEGLEVIAVGKISAFPGQSKYQLIIESMEVAGVGALMALFEKRKKELAAAGLFDQARKKKLPFMPKRIGVVTSPTGAVIRDILHRIEERFPTHMLVWPVRVQGKEAHCEIGAAIKGFNELPEHLRPELLIVARGGGSLEDLWCFNEVEVAYAVAESKIPIISAVGHETDTTLIDYVSDLRAPTPTAAAELAVPVLSEWRYTIADYKNRMEKGSSRMLAQKANEISGLVRGLPKLSDILANYMQKLDDRVERLNNALPNLFLKYEKRLAGLNLRPQVLLNDVEKIAANFNIYNERLHNALPNLVTRYEKRLAELKLTPKLLLGDINKLAERLHMVFDRAKNSASFMVEKKTYQFESLTKLFDSYNYKNVLKRGFALVKGENGKLIRSAEDAKGNMQIEFADGIKGVKSND